MRQSYTAGSQITQRDWFHVGGFIKGRGRESQRLSLGRVGEREKERERERRWYEFSYKMIQSMHRWSAGGPQVASQMPDIPFVRSFGAGLKDTCLGIPTFLPFGFVKK